MIETILMESRPVSKSGDASTVSSNSAQPTLYRKLEYYRNRLLKIDTSNRSILLRSIRDQWSFDLAAVSSAKDIIDHALSDRKSLCIVSNSDKTKYAENERARLRKLYRNTLEIERETGRQEIYLGFPFVVGHINKQLYVRAPLILFPASVTYREEGRPAGWYLVFAEDKDPIVNRALIERIKIEGGQSLPSSFNDDFENLLDKLEEIRGKAHQSLELLFLEGLTKVLRNYDFPIDYNHQFNEAQFLNKINVSGGKLSIDDKKSWIENDELRLEGYKVIGNFPQGENAIFLDYEELMKDVKAGKEDFGILEKLLPNDPLSSSNIANDEVDKDREFESLKLDDIPSNNIHSAIQSDASQDTVVFASQSSECIVVRGPPGTGKSQVIVNLISNALSRGQKVLVVCQKKYALDVVYERLDKVGLSKHVAPLYDGKDRSLLCKKLTSIFGPRTDYGSTSIINHKFNNYSQEIDRLIDQQNRIVNSLKDEELVGVSITKLYTVSKTGYIAKLDLTDLAQEIKYHTLSHLLNIIRMLEHGCKKFDRPEFPWFYRKNFSDFGFNDKNTIIQITDRFIACFSEESDAILAHNISDQEVLIDSMASLTTSKGGMFHKLLSGGKERLARERVRKILDQSKIPDDTQDLNELRRRAMGGLHLWSHIDNLRPFLTEEGIEKLKQDFSKYGRDSFLSGLIRMRELLNDFDELQAHDRRKAELSTGERELLDRITETLPVETNWEETLKQEFYIHWIDYIESKHPDLKGQPFETYMLNRERLSELIKDQAAASPLHAR